MDSLQAFFERLAGREFHGLGRRNLDFLAGSGVAARNVKVLPFSRFRIKKAVSHCCVCYSESRKEMISSNTLTRNALTRAAASDYGPFFALSLSL